MSRSLVLLAAVLFGTTGTAQALGPAGSPIEVGAARVAVGAALLALAAYAVERRRRASVARADVARAADTPAWPLAAVLASGAGIAAYQLAFFAAVAETGVAVGTVVAIGSAPALAGALARLVDGSPLTRRWAASTALATAGVLLLVLAGSEAKVTLPGIGLALVAGAAYAVYTVGAKRTLDRGHAPEAVMARAFGLGALLLAPVLVAAGGGPLASGDGLLLALYLGAIPTALAYVLFARGLRRIAAGDAATLTLAEPLTASVLGAVVLAERPGALAVAGGALVLAGLAALALPARRGRRRAVRREPAPAGAAA
ncbi:MAG TPA: EamA family transporter [Solirubrobacteraceae bacterium]|nr:EamA family transporter [Solirubrobacteraceae bacterium]